MVVLRLRFLAGHYHERLGPGKSQAAGGGRHLAQRGGGLLEHLPGQDSALQMLRQFVRQGDLIGYQFGVGLLPAVRAEVGQQASQLLDDRPERPVLLVLRRVGEFRDGRQVVRLGLRHRLLRLLLARFPRIDLLPQRGGQPVDAGRSRAHQRRLETEVGGEFRDRAGLRLRRDRLMFRRPGAGVIAARAELAQRWVLHPASSLLHGVHALLD
jgi:hypothetical protein